MRHVWNWAVAVPAVLAALACAVGGWQGILEPPLAWSGAAFFAVIAEIGSRLGRRAKRRAQRRQAAIEALAATALLHEQLRSIHRRAA